MRSGPDGGRVGAAVATALAALVVAGCSSEGDAPGQAADESIAAGPDRPTASGSVGPTGSPVPTASGTPPAGSTPPEAAEEPTEPPPAQGCDPATYTPRAEVEVHTSARQLVGLSSHTLGAGESYRTAGHQVALFEDLLIGVVDRTGDTVTGPLRTAVVERLGRGVAEDGLSSVRVPVRIRNDGDGERGYVVYVTALRREGDWRATTCPEGVEAPEPATVAGTFAAWQRLGHGVVRCGSRNAGLSDLALQAQQEGCR